MSKRTHWFLAALLAALIGGVAAQTPESPGAYEDDAISERVKAALSREPTLRVAHITVRTSDGVVHLGGLVHYGADMARAVAVTRAVRGVSAVKNGMRFVEGPLRT
jgi:osmotically-inducible protein OsmY